MCQYYRVRANIMCARKLTSIQLSRPHDIKSLQEGQRFLAKRPVRCCLYNFYLVKHHNSYRSPYISHKTVTLFLTPRVHPRSNLTANRKQLEASRSADCSHPRRPYRKIVMPENCTWSCLNVCKISTF